ncbi:hypothetical protein D9758_009622 [Tetrapyrgos nigripes]|uniref:G domain-containing protein n=1 Tax=Tetrapyrgos nigripes TaxID=182062 RepID=A0A8H5GCZ7_9AGAR|nr:hypothetical protein D9758_009622 [Tetrapyrgos nigripes]
MPSSVPPPKTPNVIVFGQTGCGKSSVVNMLEPTLDLALVDNTAHGVTFHAQSYMKTVEGTSFRVYDTVGLNEGLEGRVAAINAIEQLYQLLRELDEVNLLAYVMQASRITPATVSNYQLFYQIMCEKEVPIVAIFTHLENEDVMDDWWTSNQGAFDKKKMKFDRTACITTIKGKRGVFEKEYAESKEKLNKLILHHHKPKGWVPDKKGWFQSIISKVAFRHRVAPSKLASNIIDALVKFAGMTEREAKEKAGQIRDRVDKIINDKNNGIAELEEVEKNGEEDEEAEDDNSSINSADYYEMPHPFDQIGRKLLELEAQNTPKSTSLASIKSLATNGASLTEEGSLHDADTNADAEEPRYKLNANPSVSGTSIAEALSYLSFNSDYEDQHQPSSRHSSPLLPDSQLPTSTSSNSVFTEYVSASNLQDIPATPDNNLLDGNKTLSLLIPPAMSSRSAICHYLTNSSSAQSPALTTASVLSTISSTNAVSGCLTGSFSTQSFASESSQSGGPLSSLGSSPSVFQSFSAHRRGASLYTLPNVPISLSPMEKSFPMIDLASTTTTSEIDVHPVSFTEANTDNFIQELENAHSIFANIQDFKSLEKTFSFLLKIISFLPWCILVGSTIFLSPRNLEVVAFSPTPGFISPSPRGLHRFAYWADCAIAHIVTFLAFLVTISAWSLPVGIVVASMVFGQTVLAWQDFRFDGNVALGADDRQSIYLAVRMYMASDDDEGYHFNGDGFGVGKSLSRALDSLKTRAGEGGNANANDSDDELSVDEGK